MKVFVYIQRLILADEWLCQTKRILVIVSFPIEYICRFPIDWFLHLPLSPLFPLVSSTELSVSIINSPARHLISLQTDGRDKGEKWMEEMNYFGWTSNRISRSCHTDIFASCVPDAIFFSDWLIKCVKKFDNSHYVHWIQRGFFTSICLTFTDVTLFLFDNLITIIFNNDCFKSIG